MSFGKLKTTPTDLSKLGNVVKKEVVKNAEYDKLCKKVNTIDTSKLGSKTNYNVKIKDILMLFLLLLEIRYQTSIC